jgi:hypothetical protein
MPPPVTNEAGVQSALLFMPDISGFTEFVSNTEIQHAQSIISELLEIIMESNQIDMQVNSIEGDAIFFYRFGKAPTLEQLLEQVQFMFLRFHKHLQLYDHDRICPCGACSGAKHLKLKFFVHYGELSSYSIKDHHQLFGRDVIILHRLMKNNLDKKEYTLLTNSVLEQHDPSERHSLYDDATPAMEQYDTGDIHFKVIDLTVLYQKLEPVERTSIHLSDKTKVSFCEERVLETPIEDVFLSIFDIPQRAHWMEGVTGIEMIQKPGVNRAGTIHRCIATTGGNPVFITEKGSGNDKEITFVEMDPKGLGGSKFHLQKKEANKTLIKWDMLVNRNFFIIMMFDLMMKRKMRRLFAKSVDNLQEYCISVNQKFADTPT